jgi:hypothetical protein
MKNENISSLGTIFCVILSCILLYRTGYICHFWDVSQFYEQSDLLGTITPLSPWSSDFAFRLFILEILPEKTELQLQGGF